MITLLTSHPQRLSSNHRASDVLALSSGPSPTLHAKFQYGPLDMVSLAKEMVSPSPLVVGVALIIMAVGGPLCTESERKDHFLATLGYHGHRQTRPCVLHTEP